MLVTTSFSGLDRMDNLLKDHRYPLFHWQFSIARFAENFAHQLGPFQSEQVKKSRGELEKVLRSLKPQPGRSSHPLRLISVSHNPAGFGFAGSYCATRIFRARPIFDSSQMP